MDTDTKPAQSNAKGGQLALGRKVWEWPEFQALIERLGVTFRPHTLRVVLDIAYDGVARITETFACEDKMDTAPKRATKETK